METREQIQAVLSHYPRWAGVDANVSMVYTARLTARDERYVRETVERLGRMNQLAVNANYAQAYQTFFDAHSDLALEGNMKIFDEALLEQGEAVTAENLELLLVPGNPFNVLGQISITAKAANDAAEEQERNTIVAELTKPLVDAKGKPLLDERGRTRYSFEVERIKSLGLDELRSMHAAQAETQRLRSLPKEELRTAVRQQAQAHQQALWDARFPKLPTTYFPQGQEVPLDARALKRMDAEELRRIKKIYGDEQLNKRLAGLD